MLTRLFPNGNALFDFQGDTKGYLYLLTIRVTFVVLGQESVSHVNG